MGSSDPEARGDVMAYALIAAAAADEPCYPLRPRNDGRGTRRPARVPTPANPLVLYPSGPQPLAGWVGVVVVLWTGDKASGLGF